MDASRSRLNTGDANDTTALLKMLHLQLAYALTNWIKVSTSACKHHPVTDCPSATSQLSHNLQLVQPQNGIIYLDLYC